MLNETEPVRNAAIVLAEIEAKVSELNLFSLQGGQDCVVVARIIAALQAVYTEQCDGGA